MIKHSRCKQTEAQCIFNRQFFKRWREEISACTNACLFSLALIFKAIFLRNYSEGKNMLNSYMFNSIISGKKKTFLILEWIYKTRQSGLQSLWEKRGRSAIGSLVFDFALHAKHILSHLLALLWALSWQIEQVLLTAAMHLEQTWICLYVQFWQMKWKLAFQGTFQGFASTVLGKLVHPERKIGSALKVWKTSAILNRQSQVKWYPHSCLPDFRQVSRDRIIESFGLEETLRIT